MRQLLLTFVLITGCALPEGIHSSEDEAAYEAVELAWTNSGLPAPARYCRLELFKIFTPDDKGYWNSCGDPAKSYGCSFLVEYGRPLKSVSIPHIYIAPWYHSEPYLIVHELLHGFSICALGERGHNNPLVWETAGHQNSVQTKAVEILRADGWL